MRRRAVMLLLLGLAAWPVLAQPGPGLFGDRRYRAPVANVAALPATAAEGEVRLTLDTFSLYAWDGDSWVAITGGGSAGDPPHSRTVTVDAGGLGDYSTIGAALAYVATQTRNESTQWLVLVYPGEAQPATGYEDLFNYTEAAALTVPSFTTLQGVATGHETPTSWNGIPILKLTTSTGPAMVLQSGSAVANLRIVYWGTPSAPLSVVATDQTVAYASAAVLTNVVIEAWTLADGGPAITNLENSDDGVALYAYETSLAMQLGASGVAAGSSLAATSSIQGTSLYGGRYTAVSGCSTAFRSTGGTLKFFWSRIDSDCATDISAAGGAVRMIGTPYQTSSGTITHDDGTQGIQFCKSYSGTGSPENVLAAPVCSSYWRRDGGAAALLYLKESGSGNTGWVAVDSAADDDVPEAGDFGALALTGPVTSSGLATTIAADAVALGSQTSGGYAASSTEGGPATTATALDANGTNCSGGQFAAGVDASGNAEGCAAPSAGIGGTVGTTSDAIPVADGTGGSTLKASTVKVTSGELLVPDGSASAGGIRFQGATAARLYGSSETINVATGGVTRWTLSNLEIRSQNNGIFKNTGPGEPTFVVTGSYGLGASSSSAATMYVAGFAAEEWTRPAGGVYRASILGQAVDTPQAVTCADNGTGSAAAVTVAPTGAAIYITNSDANGCAVTLGETNVVTGQRIELVVVSNAGGTVDYADTAGVTELAGAFSAGLYDSLALRYISDRWIETGRSDN